MRFGNFHHHKIHMLRSALIEMGVMLTLAVVVASLNAAPFVPPLNAQEQTQEPTVLPTDTPSPTATLTPTASPTVSPTATAALTETPTASATATETATVTPPSPTWTPLVQTVVVPATIVIPATIIVPATVIVPATSLPPTPLPLPSAIPIQPTPFMTATRAYGWSRHESIELIQVIGSWALTRHRAASDGAYHESASAGATLRFPFTGDGVRLIYRAHPQGGRFAVLLDGVAQGVYDTRAEDEGFYYAGPFFFTSGYHVVDVVALVDRSGVTSISIDALDVFYGPPMPTRPAPTDIPIAESTAQAETRRDVINIDLISAPPTPQPTPTAIPQALVSVEVVIAYDLNRNDSADANEGVQGMSVRLLDAATNQPLAAGLTDTSGFVTLQALTTNAVTVIVPYLGETFNVRSARGRAQTARWTLLLEAGTQPGLIP
jgi:hypothetical protein